MLCAGCGLVQVETDLTKVSVALCKRCFSMLNKQGDVNNGDQNKSWGNLPIDDSPYLQRIAKRIPEEFKD